MEDYYEILGVSPDASAENIRAARNRKAMDFHPDRLSSVSEPVRNLAEEQLKNVNRAYEVLSDVQERKKYDAEWIQTHSPPKPVVRPSIIRFDDAAPGDFHTGSFTIQNQGGAYTKLWFSDPDSWVKVTGYESVSDADELPLRVNLELIGQEWNKRYTETITVRLDDVETTVRVELHTKTTTADVRSGTRAATASSGATPRATSAGTAWATGGAPRRNVSNKSIPGLFKVFVSLCVIGVILAVGIAVTIQSQSSSPTIAEISNFNVVRSGDFLRLTFSLLDANDQFVASDGEAFVLIRDNRGAVVPMQTQEQTVQFSKKQFNLESGTPTYSWSIRTPNIEFGTIPMPAKIDTIREVAFFTVSSTITLQNGDVIFQTEDKRVDWYFDETDQELATRLNSERADTSILAFAERKWPNRKKGEVFKYVPAGGGAWAIVCFSDMYYGICEQKELLYSPNALSEWVVNDAYAVRSDFDNPRDVEFVDTEQGWLATRWTAFHTRDAGKSWEIIWESTMGWDALTGIEVVTPLKLRLYTSAAPAIFFDTCDGGETWASGEPQAGRFFRCN